MTGSTTATRASADAGAAPRRVEISLQIEVFGSINPAIFTPSWFSREGLLREQDVAEAADEVVEDVEGYVRFQTGDLVVEVTPERFALLSHNQSLEFAHRDVVLYTFERLRHTPLDLLAVTWTGLYTTADGRPELQWERVANPSPWAGIFDGAPRGTVDLVTVTGPAGREGLELIVSAEASGRPDVPLVVRTSYSRRMRRGDEGALAHGLKDDWEHMVNHSSSAMDLIAASLLASGSAG